MQHSRRGSSGGVEPLDGVLRLFGAGATFSLRDAAWMMVVVSDNTATDICLESAGGVAAVNATMSEIGIDGIEMTGSALDWFRALGGSMDPELTNVSPGEFARRGYPSLGPAGLADARARFHFETGRPFSLAMPRALGNLLAQIHARTCATTTSCELMLEILAGQLLKEMAPRFVWGAKFAHKTGNFEPFIASDIAIATPWRGTQVIMCFLSQRHKGRRGRLRIASAEWPNLSSSKQKQGIEPWSHSWVLPEDISVTRGTLRANSGASAKSATRPIVDPHQC